MISSIFVLVTSYVLYASVELVVKYLVGAALAVFLGFTGAAYSGQIDKLSGFWATRKYRRFIRGRRDLVQTLSDLNDRAAGQIGQDPNRTNSFGFVGENTVMSSLRKAATGFDKNQGVAFAEAQGLWEAYLEHRSRWGYVRDAISASLGGYGAKDSLDFLDSAKVLHASLSAFYSVVSRFVRLARSVGIDWTEDQLDEWDSFKVDANTLAEDMARFGKEVERTYPGTGLSFWVPRIISLKNRGESGESPASTGATPPARPTDTPKEVKG